MLSGQYLSLCVVLIVFWILCFFLIKSRPLRSKMLWSSLIVAPIGFTEFFFVPDYWHPDAIWSFHRLDVESFIFCFAVGGLAGVFYEMIFNTTLRKTAHGSRGKNWTLLFLMAIVGIISCLILQINFMYDSFIALIAGILYLTFSRKDLRKEMFIGGFIFAIFYLIIFGIMLLLSKDFLNLWSLENLSKIYFLGVPIEEIAWAFLFGCVWASFYEDINNCRLVYLGKHGKVTSI